MIRAGMGRRGREPPVPLRQFALRSRQHQRHPCQSPRFAIKPSQPEPAPAAATRTYRDADAFTTSHLPNLCTSDGSGSQLNHHRYQLGSPSLIS